MKTKQKARTKPGRTGKLGHDSIPTRRLDSLRPATLNDKVYRPVDPADPDVKALADSIGTNGLKEPIVITLDGVILSGHRRRVACQLAGLEVVRVRVEPIRSTDPDF